MTLFQKVIGLNARGGSLKILNCETAATHCMIAVTPTCDGDPRCPEVLRHEGLVELKELICEHYTEDAHSCVLLFTALPMPQCAAIPSAQLIKDHQECRPLGAASCARREPPSVVESMNAWRVLS